MEDKEKRLDWVVPEIKELDVLAETQSGYTGTGSDNSDYS